MSDPARPQDRINRPRKFKLTEIGNIISQFKMLTAVQNRGIREACAIIAPDYGRTTDAIYQLIQRFRPSVDGAEAYMKANALRLAMRVVRKASSEQAIDILSRSNVGVLAPKADGGGANQGFFLSVQADTCGAVKITAGGVQPQRYADLPQPLLIDEGVADVERSQQTSPSSPLRDDSGYAQVQVPIGSPTFYQEVPYVEEGSREASSEDETLEGGSAMASTRPPHSNQVNFGRFQRPREQWGKRHQLELDRAKQRIKQARQAAAAAKYRDMEV